MKFNKWTIGLAAVASLALFTPSTSVAGPTENSQNVDIALPNIPAATTTNLATPIWIGCEKQQQVAMMWQANCSVAGASAATNALLTYCPSVDGSRPDTNKVSTLSIPLNGTAVLLVTTNDSPKGYAGFFITSLQNTHSAGIVTNSFRYRAKIGFP